MPTFHVATFSCAATPPDGHPLCGGWIEPVRAVDDPLKALGVVLVGAGAPVVLCAVDWCGIRNDTHIAWRQALAKAAHTTPDRVAVQCVHPHNAPFADTEAEKLLEANPGAPLSLDLKFFDRAVFDVSRAVQTALAKTTPFTHICTCQAKVEEVASNRRIVSPEGNSIATRYSATKDSKRHAYPAGLIDPRLKTLRFWDGGSPP